MSQQTAADDRPLAQRSLRKEILDRVAAYCHITSQGLVSVPCRGANRRGFCIKGDRVMKLELVPYCGWNFNSGRHPGVHISPGFHFADFDLGV